MGSSTSRNTTLTLVLDVDTLKCLAKIRPFRQTLSSEDAALKLAYRGAVHAKPATCFILSLFLESAVPCLISE